MAKVKIFGWLLVFKHDFAAVLALAVTEIKVLSNLHPLICCNKCFDFLIMTI